MSNEVLKKWFKVSIFNFFNSSSSLPLFSWLLQWLQALSMLHCQFIMPQLITLPTLHSSTITTQNQSHTQNTNSTMELRTHIPEMWNHNTKFVMEMSSRDNTHLSNQTVQSVPLITPLMTTMVSLLKVEGHTYEGINKHVSSTQSGFNAVVSKTAPAIHHAPIIHKAVVAAPAHYVHAAPYYHH
jgi:hypothetical protein